MWTDWIPAAVLVAIITLVGGIYATKKTRQSAKEANEINEAELIISTLKDDVKELRERADKTDAKLSGQAEQIRQLQQSDWSLRRYIYRLIDWGRSLGGEPPEPPSHLNL
ncbi:hypothetical protein PGC08_14030 [Brevibacterium sp. BDJS002]|uniref:hypothetical protein n=1 Tax=Brevibacterium sp. BDJS002 TaxID=3020906 RepID=UPI0023072B21|nr:hypothetical protein [Brevibacterium sp. BDJS002]WCE39109.1 hypothetical protein PGC08_14030 [Brevibacterium sp. BDJS002]